MFSFAFPSLCLGFIVFARGLNLLIIFLLSTTAQAASVQDDTQREFQFNKPAQRIVSLSPHVTELLFAVGAGSNVIAVSDFSDYPAAAKQLPKVGGYQGLDLERIAALRPDLVIAWNSGNSAGQVEAIARLGIPIFRSEPKSLEDVATSLERFGQLSGHDVEGQQAARAFRQRALGLRQHYANKAPVRVFYQIWNRPLMTVGGTHLISKVIELCGGQNIFASIDALAPVVDAEAVIVANPELMVIASSSANAHESESLALWKKWPQIAAVAQQQYLAIDPALIVRHTPRILDGAELLCRSIDQIRSH